MLLSTISDFIRSFCTQKVTLEEGRKAFMQLREEAKANKLQEMTLEEINAEIKAYRAGK